MSLFVSSQQSVTRPGVYAIEVSPPRQIRGVSNGYVLVVGKFAWGPVGGTLVQPGSSRELIQTFEPAGSPRSSSGYYAIMQRLGAPWIIGGQKGSGSAAALKSDTGTGGNLVFTAKYNGALGNNIQRTIGAASNGDATARDLTVTLTDPVTGTTKEIYKNTYMNTTIDTSKSDLLASLVFSGGTMTAWPSSGTANLAGGSDGSALVANDYQTVLTAAQANANVRVVCTDDPGDSIRNAVNTNVVSHCTLTTNRVCFLQGSPTAADWPTVQTDKAAYSSDRASYCGAWVQAYDDGGVLRTVPFSTFVATARVALPVHRSVAWRDPSATQYFQNIKGIVANFSTADDSVQDTATSLGIMLPIQLPGLTPGSTAGYGLLHGRTTNITDPNLKWEAVRWYKDYLALTLIPQLGPFVNGNNLSDENLTIKGVVDGFMDDEQNRLKHIQAFSTDIDTDNSTTSLANGDFVIDLNVNFPGIRERIFIKMNVGASVVV